MIGLLGNTYYFVIFGTKLQWLVDEYLSIFISTRNAIFVAFYFVSVGVWIAERKEKGKVLKEKKKIAIVWYCLFILETYLVKNCQSADDKSMFISFLILIPILFSVIVESNVRIKSAKLFRSYSTGIYFTHKAVIHVWLLALTMVVLNWEKLKNLFLCLQVVLLLVVLLIK